MTPFLRDDASVSPFVANDSVGLVSVCETETETEASERRLALLVTEEEADALMAVLLLAPLEGGPMGDAMERVLSRVADVQRAFARDEMG